MCCSPACDVRATCNESVLISTQVESDECNYPYSSLKIKNQNVNQISMPKRNARLPRRVAFATTFAFATATTATTTATTTHAQVRGIVLALAVIIFGVVVHSIALLGSLKLWALLDVSEDIVTAIVWGDEAKALVLEELLDSA